MYSICACSSYGRICASYFCIVGSKGTRLMAETLPLRETHDFVWTSISCLWIFWLKQTAMVQRWWRKKTVKWQELNQIRVMVTGCYYRVIYPSKQMTSSTDVHKGQEEIGSFVVAIVFLFLFFQPVCFVFLCIYVSNMMCAIKPRNTVLNHPAADKTLML